MCAQLNDIQIPNTEGHVHNLSFLITLDVQHQLLVERGRQSIKKKCRAPGPKLDSVACIGLERVRVKESIAFPVLDIYG